MDTVIFIAFCVFLFLVGYRLRQRFRKVRLSEDTLLQKSRPSLEQEEPEIVRERRRGREERTRRFTIAMLCVLFLLMAFMIPMLMRDVQRFGQIDKMNFIMRIVIFLFTLYVFVLGYLKIFSKRKPPEDLQA